MCLARNPLLFALPLLLLLAWLIYQPGLSGEFILDDYQNLKTLERIQAPPTLQSLFSVIFTNPSGNMGRILPMLTFAAQYKSWPGDPYAFKQVNLLIHLANAVLLFILTRQIGRARNLPEDHNTVVALLISAIWVLHPMHVSTVLYVVQRMSMLSCFFLLITFIVYMHGRKIAEETPYRGYFLMSAGILLFGGLALICKENAALLPLYILILEGTMLHDYGQNPLLKNWKRFFLWLPLGLFLSIFTLKYLEGISSAYALREFSLTERLLTESRAVINYLGLLLLPRAGEFGLFHDDFPLSHGLLSPPTTLLSLAILVILVGTAIHQRRKCPTYSFSVLMFLGAHLLESSFIPLEIYFEHRNYFPSIGLFIGLGFTLQQVYVHVSAQSRWKMFAIATTTVLALLCATTWNESRLWGNPFAQAKVWAIQHPHSERAQLRLATSHIIRGNYSAAADIYSVLSEKFPASYTIWAHLLCDSQISIDEYPFDKAIVSLQKAKFSKASSNAIEQIVIAKEAGKCVGLPKQKAIALIDTILNNENYQTQKHLWLTMKGRLLIAENQISEGLSCFDSAFVLSRNVELALLSVKVSAQSGNLTRAEQYLKIARESNTLNSLTKFSYAEDIKDWEKWLESSQKNKLRTAD